MDKSDALNIAREALGPMLSALSLTHWTINLTADSEDDHETLASVSFNHLYASATINIDPNKLSNPTAILASLRHELIHLLLSPYDMPETLLPECTEAPITPTLLKSLEHANELSILNLETTLDALGHTASALAQYTQPQVNSPSKKSRTKKPRGRKKTT